MKRYVTAHILKISSVIGLFFFSRWGDFVVLSSSFVVVFRKLLLSREPILFDVHEENVKQVGSFESFWIYGFSTNERSEFYSRLRD